MKADVLVVIISLILVSIALLVSSFRKVPGIGIIISVVIILANIVFLKLGLMSLGYFAPKNWIWTILAGLGFGFLIAFLSTAFIEPISDKITKTRIDLSMFSKLKGDWKKTIMMIGIGWLLAAFLEESIFRGFIFQRMANVFGGSVLAWVIAAFTSSILFGLAHWYQGRSGALTTGFIGLIFCALFYFSGRNIWLPILTHGFIDTVGLLMTFLGWDLQIKKKIWGIV